MLLQAFRDDAQDLVLIVLAEAVRTTYIIDRLTSLLSTYPSGGDSVIADDLQDALALMTETRTCLLDIADHCYQQ
jgi:hypothetical protein